MNNTMPETIENMGDSHNNARDAAEPCLLGEAVCVASAMRERCIQGWRHSGLTARSFCS